MKLYSDSSRGRDLWLWQNGILTMLSSPVSVGLLVAHRVIHVCLAVHEINGEAVYPIRYFFQFQKKFKSYSVER